MRWILLSFVRQHRPKKNCLLGKFYGHYDPALFHARLLHVKERRRAGSLIILYTVLMSDGYICRRR